MKRSARKAQKHRRPERTGKELARRAPCVFCGAAISVLEHTCYGCDKIVCDECDKTQPTGRHDVLAHVKE